MQQRYYGLTLGQVYENRMRYGANVVNPPTTENWSVKLHNVSSFWLIKLLNFISLMAIFLLPLLDLLGVEMSIKIWSIFGYHKQIGGIGHHLLNLCRFSLRSRLHDKE